MTRRLLALLGQTASGKTALALDIARETAGAIISADSRQIYLGMTIGTAKPGERHGALDPRRPVLVQDIPHYLLDILTPDQSYSVSNFCRDATAVIGDLSKDKQLPIVVGGTGQYVRALLEGLPTQAVPPDPVFRRWAATQSLTTLSAELIRMAPDIARTLDLRNPRRVTRALEVMRGRGASGADSAHAERRAPAIADDILKLALVVEPTALKKRITERVKAQLAAGLIDEVRRLVARYGREAPGLQAIAYREVFPHLRGERSPEDTREAIIRANWQYARRQMTWLKREPRLTWVPSPAVALARVKKWLARNP